jgi:hypothetical protein
MGQSNIYNVYPLLYPTTLLDMLALAWRADLGRVKLILDQLLSLLYPLDLLPHPCLRGELALSSDLA